MVTVTVRDANANAVAGQAVMLSVSGSNNALSASSGASGADGRFVATLSSTTAEAKTVTANVGSVTVSTIVTFDAGAPSAATSTLVASPTTVTADGSSTAALTLTLKDAKGNPIAGQPVSLSSSGSANSLTPASGTTDANGLFSATLASTTAEAKTVTAAVGNTAVSANVTFVAGAPSAANSVIVASLSTLTADGTSTTTLTVTLTDANGNAVSDQLVTLSATGSANTFSPPTGSTDANGVFTATLSSTRAEPKVVSAAFNGSSVTTTVTFVAGAPASTTSSLIADPTPVTADGVSTTMLALTVEDASGNPVPGQAVTLSSSGSANVFTPTSGTTDSSGVFTATLASTLAETKTVTATFADASASAMVVFAAGAPSSLRSSMVASPTTLTADGVSATTLTVRVLDSNDNPVAGQLVTIGSSGTNNLLIPASGATDASGVFTATLASTTAETKTVTADIGSFSLTASVGFSPGAPSASTSTLTASASSLVADGATTTTLTLTVRDALGNPVPDQSVSLSSSGASNVFSPAQPIGVTAADGTFSATLASTKAEAKTITATVGSFLTTTSVTFIAGAPDLNNSTFSASPGTVVADGVSTTTLTVTLLDAHANPVPSTAVSIAASGYANTFSPAPPTGSTNASGQLVATLASTKAETKNLTATAGSLSIITSVSFVADVPSASTSTLVATPTSLTADGTTTTSIVFTVLDAHSNPVINSAASITSSGSGNRFNPSPASGTTDANGQLTATLASTRAETKTLTGHAGTMTTTTSVTFTPGAPSASRSTISAVPSTVIAGHATTLTVTVRDAQSNPVPNQAVALSSSGSNNTFTPTPPSGNTDSAGVFSATLSSTKAEVKTVTATLAGFNLVRSVTFTADTATQLAFTTQPQAHAAAGSALPGSVQVAYEDAYGNINTSAASAISMSFGVNACSGATLTGSTTIFPGAGVATFANLVVSKMGQGYTLAAAGGGLSATSSAFDVYGWVSINNGLYGGYGQGIAIDPQAPSTLYAAVGNDLYKSVNGAASWTRLATGSVGADRIAVDPTNSAKVYFDTSSQFLRSSDGGSTWTASSLPMQGGGDVEIDPTSTSTIYVAGYGNVQKSTDGGATWSASTTGLPSQNIVGLALAASSPQTLYAAMYGNGVYKSTDGGATWSNSSGNVPLPPASNGVAVYDVDIDPTNASHVVITTNVDPYRSTDGGATWTQATGVSTSSTRIRFQPGNPSIVYNIGFNIARSTDGGATYSTLSPVFSSESVSDFAIDPVTPSNLYFATTVNAVFKSINSGTSVATANSGVTSTNPNALATAATTPATIYAGISGGVFKSVDAGATWAATGGGMGFSSVGDLAVDPTSPSTVYSSNFYALYKSTSAGASWTTAYSYPSAVYPHCFALDPNAPSTLYAVSYNTKQLYKSTNGGAAFTTTTMAVGYDWVKALAIDPATSTLYVVGFVNATGLYVVYKSTDGGATWQLLPAAPSQNVYALTVDAASRLYLASNNTVSVSSDGGATFSSHSSQYITSLQADSLSSSAVYGADYSGFDVTLDAGNHWLSVPPNQSYPVHPVVVAAGATLPSSTALVGGNNNGMWKVTTVCQ
jgi:adhesin/invasin